jgi:hypothetical protein
VRGALPAAFLLVVIGGAVACDGGDGDPEPAAAVEGFSGSIAGSVGERFEAPVSAAAAAKLPSLDETPQQLPSTVDTGSVVVLLILGVDDGGQVIVDDPPISLAASSLRLGRAITKRRSQRPRAWAMLTESGADVVRYWVPLDPSALVRANITTDDGAPDDEGHSPHLERVPTMYSALRIPFFPSAELEFVRVDGTGAGAYRFGERPGDMLERIR